MCVVIPSQQLAINLVELEDATTEVPSGAIAYNLDLVVPTKVASDLINLVHKEDVGALTKLLKSLPKHSVVAFVQETVKIVYTRRNRGWRVAEFDNPINYQGIVFPDDVQDNVAQDTAVSKDNVAQDNTVSKDAVDVVGIW